MVERRGRRKNVVFVRRIEQRNILCSAGTRSGRVGAIGSNAGMRGLVICEQAINFIGKAEGGVSDGRLGRWGGEG